MKTKRRKAALEAIIYAADEPATIDQLARAMGEEKLEVQGRRWMSWWRAMRPKSAGSSARGGRRVQVVYEAAAA